MFCAWWWLTPGANGSIPVASESVADDFCDHVVRGCGVLLLPGTVYNVTAAPYVRVGYGRQSLAAALDALDRFLCAATAAS